jgi:hypothetical protein
MPDHDPHIEFSLIPFPSDELSIRRLRDRFPKSFDRTNDDIRFFRSAVDDVDVMMKIEGQLARKSFHDALGRETKAPGWGWEQARANLTDLYVQFGLASGPHHAEQLIREFEHTAADQARGAGRSPAGR